MEGVEDVLVVPGSSKATAQQGRRKLYERPGRQLLQGFNPYTAVQFIIIFASPQQAATGAQTAIAVTTSEDFAVRAQAPLSCSACCKQSGFLCGVP